MLSILIPTYNYDIYPLVEDLESQAKKLAITFEIICIDDYSETLLFDTEKLASLSHTNVKLLNKNIGRSAIRNLLMQSARYDNLLFVDAGTQPKSKHFIKNYLKYISNTVVIGGMIETLIAPKKPYKLRWLYTKKRESVNNTKTPKKQILTTANFLIKKHVAILYPFNDSIKKYGYEDYLFFSKLKAQGIDFKFIKNPVVHDPKEEAQTFITKTEHGVTNLKNLLEQNNTFIENNTLIKTFLLLKKIRLHNLIGFFFRLLKPVLIINFKSKYPSLLLFDFYKIGYLCTLNPK